MEFAILVKRSQGCVGQTVPSTPVMSGAATSSRSPLLGFSPLRHADVTKLPGCILDVISSGFTKLTPRQREQLLQHLFRQWMVNDIKEAPYSWFSLKHFLYRSESSRDSRVESSRSGEIFKNYI